MEELIKMIEQMQDEHLIEAWFHHTAEDGTPQLNISFNTEDIWDMIPQSKIEVINQCAIWE